MSNEHSAPEGANQPSKQPPPAEAPLFFRVDKDRFEAEKPIMTGREILAAAGKTPEEFKLYKHVHGNQPIPIGPDDKVDLREPGLERFSTMPKGTTDGFEAATLRREFTLPEADASYLDSLGLPWETVMDGGKGGKQWLIIHDWKIVTGYNFEKVTLALLIPANYSDSQIDMVYFKEHLARKDGRSIPNLANETICGAQWQRWSRHRTETKSWRAGIDDVASHLCLVDEWLRREFEKQ